MTGLWITAGVCVLLAILLFCGKCSFIIIGYNTAPPEVKAYFYSASSALTSTERTAVRRIRILVQL